MKSGEEISLGAPLEDTVFEIAVQLWYLKVCSGSTAFRDGFYLIKTLNCFTLLYLFTLENHDIEL